MHLIKRHLTFVMLSIFCSILLFSPPLYTHAAMPIPTQSSQPTQYKDLIEWRYKVENGLIYRRLFNYTKNCWVGEWELHP